MNTSPSRVHLVSPHGSERATSGAGNKIVSRRGKSHIVWQDSTEEGYLNQIRTFEHQSGTFTETVTLNLGVDNHARPNILMDHDGYLHAVLSGHNSPTTYRRSLEPDDASAWSEPETIGGGTYPVPVCAPDGTMYVLMRAGENWNGADLFVKPLNQPWRMQCKLVYRDPQMPGYGAFHGGLAVADDGTLHAVVNFYESRAFYDQRGLHQAICYMKSVDRGNSWTKADGTPVQVPARPPQMDTLARDEAERRHENMPPPLLNAAGNIVLDARRRPHILYLDHRQGPGRVIRAVPDGEGRWRRSAIAALEKAWPNHRTTSVRGALTIRSDGTMFALVELQPLDEGWHDGLPTRGMNFIENADKRLAWLISGDSGDNWHAQQALDVSDFNQPNVERPTGGNRLPEDRLPPFIYFDGASRYPEKGEILQNNVYFVVPETDAVPTNCR